MKAVDFDYLRPASLAEACAALAGGGEPRIIAGGQTLVPLMAMRLARPSLLVDIGRLAELQDITVGASAVLVGAATRQAAALGSTAIRRWLPLLAKALGFVGHVQTRNRGTIGGSLANADPAAEIGLVAVTLDAALHVRSARAERTIAAAAFFRSAMVTALAPEECLTGASFPVWREFGRLGTGFQELSTRRSDFALAAAAVQLGVDDDGRCRRVAIGIGGAGPVPQRAPAAEDGLLGTPLAARDLTEAARRAGAEVVCLGDPHAPAEYRRRVVGGLVARALAEARTEASGGAG